MHVFGHTEEMLQTRLIRGVKEESRQNSQELHTELEIRIS